MTPVSTLNATDVGGFVAVCGPLFEHSSWIAKETASRRPFRNREALHESLVATMFAASREAQVELIASHPDLVGRLAREGRLTRESTGEQAAAGLNALNTAEIAAFDRYNAAYREKFGFPFVICARENKKEAILAALPARLENDRDQEIATALGEIAKIARLRLNDRVSDE